MLEDEFCDIITKAQRGRECDVTELAQRSGLSRETLAALAGGEQRPTADQARAIARVLELEPDRLAAVADGRSYPTARLPDGVFMYLQPPHPSNGYVILSNDRRQAAIIDPAGDARDALRILTQTGAQLRYVLITHRHADHCDAVGRILIAHPHARIVMNTGEAVTAFGSLPINLIGADDDTSIAFGDEYITAMTTRGHTDGATSFLYHGLVFVGDTLFARSVGRVFGPTSTYAELLKNIRNRIFSLPPHTVILPGHGPITSVEDERAYNPFFK